MRIVLATAAGVLLGVSTSAPPSKAEITYPWCAQYAEADAIRNCSFTTYEQCLAAVSGNGGFCEPNPLFQPGIPARKLRR